MTSIEWLCSQIYTIQVELEAGNNDLKNKIEKAKEIEREQIENAYAQALANERDCDLGMRELCSAHTYYEKTYIK